MTVATQGSESLDAPASTDDQKPGVTTPAADATATPPPTSGEGQPPAPKQADPPAAESKQDKTGDQTAPPDPAATMQQAIEDHPVLRRLAGSDKTTEKKQQTKAPDAKPSKDGKEPAKPAATSSTTSTDDEPPADPKERNRAFAELRTKHRALEREVESAKADSQFGKEMADLFTKEGVFDDFKVVQDEQLAGVVRIQAALNRAEDAAAKGGQPSDTDRKIISTAIETLEAIAGKAGITRANAIPEAITGDLPERWADLVQLGMMSEAEARQYAAVDQAKARKGASATAPAATSQPKADPPARTEDRKPATMPERRTMPAVTPQVSADEAVARNLSRNHLVSCGIAKDQVGAHYKANLLPIILGEYVQPIPGKDQAATFLALSPMTQHALVERAQAAWQQKQEKLKRPAGESERKAGDAPISPLMRRRLGNGLPTQFAGGSPEAQAKKTLAFLAGAPAEQ